MKHLPTPNQRQGGYVIVMTAMVMAALAVAVMVAMSSYIIELGRSHVRVRDNAIAVDIAETFGQRLRRAYDLARETASTCQMPSPPPQPPRVVGQAMAIGSFALCLPTGTTEMCERHPLMTGQSYCLKFDSAGLVASHQDKAGPLLVATIERRANWLARWTDRATVMLQETLPKTLASIDLPNVLSPAWAQKSDVHRPSPPPPGTVSFQLAPQPSCAAGTPSCRIQCGSAETDCMLIRICDSWRGCGSIREMIHQKYGFLK